MSIGKEIKETYDAMKKVCSETSHFISVVNDEFVSMGWNPVGGNGVMWDRSGHYAYPQFWLPYFQQRVFSGNNEKNKGLAINILFDEPYGGINNTIPFVSCLFVQMNNKQTVAKCDEIYSAGWSENSTSLSPEYQKFYKSEYPEHI